MPELTWRKLPAAAMHADPALCAQWDRLNAQGLNLIFMTADAVCAALACFGEGNESLVIGEHGGQPVVLMLVQPDGALRWRSFQPSQLPLGAWVAEPGRSLQSLCRSLLRGPLGFCLAFSATQVDPLQAARAADGADNRHDDYIDTAWVELAGDFDTYWAARGKNLRQNLRKQRNKLAAEGTVTALRVLTKPEEMAPAIARYGALETSGWKSQEGTAVAPDNAQGRFYTRVFEQAAARGEALVFEYLFGERTAAMNLGLCRAGTLVVLKTSYDESIPKALSPASLLREEELQYLFADQAIKRMEYYGRVMDWHTKFTPHRRTVYHLTTYRWPWLKRLAQRRRVQAPTPTPVVAEAQET
ncbi:MAG: GNAT family N-acetyltransferase [Rubrivivax sp.]|nr:GNAT family N-acetyltransferase [Rubrivivax sp.]